MAERVLLLGGTREAAALARELHAAGVDVTTSLAGRTREPRPVDGRVRTGGFGGADGLADHIRAERIDRVIDATHPFAVQISANAAVACAATNTPLDVRTRPPWPRHPHDRWQDVASEADASALLPPAARVLLALGAQRLAPFARRADVHFVVRMIDPPVTPLPFARHTLLLSRPSTDWREEAATLREHAITHVVSRNAGGAGAYAKIEAARRLRLPVLMIRRPPGAS